ncbi:unnamed protein product [Trichogramma brassicae]|uniref:Uncharacterized protein n=1 Tax=Trichogramma brassicae TaxID=86971 RepID=A0A6H5IZH5_9HYME|nr:unnamed protein product [Trichogramma brassicae]
MEFLDLFLALAARAHACARQLRGAILTIVSKISAARKIKRAATRSGQQQQRRVPGTIIAAIASLAKEREIEAVLRMQREQVEIISQVLRSYDENFTEKSGISNLHVACEFGVTDVVERFLKRGENPNALVRPTGNSPLHYALKRRENQHVVELLLRHGADLHLANKDGLTPLRLMCQSYGDEELMVMFIKFEINARSKLASEVLQVAACCGRKKFVECLLTLGVDPNLKSREGLATLHVVCQKDYDSKAPSSRSEIIELLVNNGANIDITNNKGCTPLLITCRGDEADKKQVLEVLLRNGADPNLANDYGSTPLHHVCQKFLEDDVAELFFKVNDEMKQTLQLGTPNKFGRTPLQLAVANFMPRTIDLLLDRGVDLSKFVFPAETLFGKKLPEDRSVLTGFDLELGDEIVLRQRIEKIKYKLELSSGAMLVVDRLEDRGYELNRKDALTIMKFFAKRKLLEETSADLQKYCYDDEKFMKEAKEMTIKPDLTLDDLMQLSHKEAAKVMNYADYLELTQSEKFKKLPSKSGEACALHLGETMARRFFRSWATISFLGLTRYRLPEEVSEIIMDTKLSNKDLFNAASTYSRQPEASCPRNNTMHSRYRTKTIHWELDIYRMFTAHDSAPVVGTARDSHVISIEICASPG